MFNDKDLKLDNSHEYEIDLYEMFIQTTDLHILRTPEPTLKVTYKPIACPFQELHSNAYNAWCKMKQGVSLGLRTQLSKLVINYHDKKN